MLDHLFYNCTVIGDLSMSLVMTSILWFPDSRIRSFQHGPFLSTLWPQRNLTFDWSIYFTEISSSWSATSSNCFISEKRIIADYKPNMMFYATCSWSLLANIYYRLGAGHCWGLLRDISMVGFSFRSCDKYGLGVITPHEFRSGIEKRLGYPMSERQWEQVKCDVGQDSDGLIPYNKFLQMFDVP